MSASRRGDRIGHDRGVEPPTRLVPLTGAFNFRDLGGYPAGAGRVTRWGRLFRSDALHLLTADDVERVRSLGVTTVIDLRTTSELEHTGPGPLAGLPVAHHHLSVITEPGGESTAAPAPPGEELSARYLWYLEAGRPALVGAFELLADPASLPVVFHCAAGKDRTGVLAALVLDLLGVDEEVIVADYLITAERMPLIIERFRNDAVYAERMATQPASRYSIDAGSMHGFVRGLHDRFGGARGWALGAGVPEEALDTMVAELTESPT
jgi:rhodanese-related sulfurtransferase